MKKEKLGKKANRKMNAEERPVATTATLQASVNISVQIGLYEELYHYDHIEKLSI